MAAPLAVVAPKTIGIANRITKGATYRKYLVKTEEVEYPVIISSPPP